ncbi:hypothetical protein IP81_10315 [Novosphingobium sp. AAP83]|uniref:hypothetical protein n=1 Tax=Novosphingobium sp. AAP83 TaxID=1523425 RepID=UPI0006B8F13F|nr:hypothetical protein [Novosphingobium sp. AAP83]KPF91575.1 hypothetical protein IP81_10315 [Novosphingobium sp. AAP83]
MEFSKEFGQFFILGDCIQRAQPFKSYQLKHDILSMKIIGHEAAKGAIAAVPGKDGLSRAAAGAVLGFLVAGPVGTAVGASAGVGAPKGQPGRNATEETFTLLVEFLKENPKIQTATVSRDELSQLSPYLSAAKKIENETTRRQEALEGEKREAERKKRDEDQRSAYLKSQYVKDEDDFEFKKDVARMVLAHSLDQNAGIENEKVQFRKKFTHLLSLDVQISDSDLSNALSSLRATAALQRKTALRDRFIHHIDHMSPEFIKKIHKTAFSTMCNSRKNNGFLKNFGITIVVVVGALGLLLAMPTNKSTVDTGQVAASDKVGSEGVTSKDIERGNSGAPALSSPADQPAAGSGVTYDGTSSDRQKFVDDYVEKEMEKADAFCARNPDYESCW